MNISIGIVAYNEEQALPGILHDILQQSYPHKQIEILLIDSMSDDNTKSIMQAFLKENKNEFFDIKIITNQARRQSSGWNCAIKNFTTEALVRIDAHSSIPCDFIEKNVKALESGENVTGGIRPCIVASDSKWQQLLLLAENSMFGSSVADFRRNEKKRYVNSIFHGAYRREVFEKAGMFNEDLGRTEDNEFHYRIRQNGFQICMVPGIISYQMIRPSLWKMCRQKFGNGYWVGMTTGICYSCLSLYHFIPFAFICGIIVTSILALLSYPLLTWTMWGAYGLLALGMAIVSSIQEKKYAGILILPVLFLLLHISYGMGTLIGLINMPFWRKKHEY